MSKSILYELDRVRNLRFGMESLSTYEEKTGDDFLSLDLNKLKITQLGTLIWSGLVWEDANLTVKDVMRLIDEHSSIVEATQKVTAAIVAAFPQAKETPQVKNPKRA